MTPARAEAATDTLILLSHPAPVPVQGSAVSDAGLSQPPPGRAGHRGHQHNPGIVIMAELGEVWTASRSVNTGPAPQQPGH
jgi:hypothetical protein